MYYTDTFIHEFTDPAFQSAFRTYFGELGCRVTNWDGLFAGMNDKHREYTWSRQDAAGRLTSFTAWMQEDNGDAAYVRKNEEGDVTGFIQFTLMDMGSWFFTARCGFIREFWIREDLRHHGHGTALLKMAEDWLKAQNCWCAVLTTATAPAFYEKQGYHHEPGIQARNGDKVFVKRL